MNNIFDIEPDEFTECLNCNSSYDVDIDEIEECFICRKCGIEWDNHSEDKND